MKKQYISFLALLGFGTIMAQNLPLVQVHINVPNTVCSPGNCTDLFADYYTPKATDSYAITSLAYNPPFPTTGGTFLDASSDDVWSPTVNLPFSFCFYGTNYNQMLVGSNGVITFDLINQPAGGFCPYNFVGNIPSTSFPIRNAIYAVYQDTNISNAAVTNPTVQNVNYYTLDVGQNAAPNRVFIANFNSLPLYQCNASAGLQTSQVVIHEGSNIIDVYVKSRTSCTGWDSGNGVLGLQNQAGTLATVPPGRNTGSWSATNEAWRFTPGGADLPVQLSWSIDGIASLSHDNPLHICPTEEHVYQAQITYDNCGSQVTVTDDYSDPIISPPLPVSNPANLTVCSSGSGLYIADIGSNDQIILSSVPNPEDYQTQYYETLVDAENSAANYLTNLQNYTFTGSHTLYVRIDDLVGGCYNIRSFELTGIPPVTPPTGEAQQDFTNGQTLANLIVTGQDILWYDAANGGNVLPSTTLLQNGFTYYAAQLENGCESRNINSVRLAVTVNLVLANQAFNNNMFSVYPNPANSVLNVSFSNNLKSVEIYNTVGQKVLAQYPDKKEVKLDISGFPVGVYFVKIGTATKQQTIKIIKE